jgi:hypothetical protein
MIQYFVSIVNKKRKNNIDKILEDTVVLREILQK